MNFAELRDEVAIWSKRPDLLAATNSAIRRNTLKMHRREKWFRDLATIDVANVTPNSPTALFDIASTFPRFRQFVRINIAGYSDALKPLAVDDLLDIDGYARSGVYLIAGTNLNVKWEAGFPTLTVTYLQDPVATEVGYSSWIANEYPDLIAASAAAELLAFDNEGELFKAAKQAELEQFALLRSNNLEVEAR